MTWHAFLTALSSGLERLDARLRALAPAIATGSDPADPPPAPVRLADRQQRAGQGQCLIDVGAHWTSDSDGKLVPVDHLGICLRDKGLAPPGPGRGSVAPDRPAGVTALALDPPSELFAHWQRAVGADAAPESFFARFALVVEDASPDSVLGLIVLLARLNGVPANAVPRAWVGTVAAWEQGQSRVADPFAHWPTLLVALGHGYWDSELFRQPPTDGTASERAALAHEADAALGAAWLACLRFTVALLAEDSPPAPIADLSICPEAGRAAAFLRYEAEQYRHALDHADTLQLRLPMQGPGGRWRIVDACLIEEQALTGALKVFLRNDRVHPWLGDGFGLMGLYRPALAGTGADMTLSVDPALGVHLPELWRALERREDAAWGGQRPCDRPRIGLAGYPAGRRPDTGAPSPNQPWWDDRGSYTLIAAPGRLSDGSPGSRLDWREDVLEALWACYKPSGALRFRCADGAVHPFEACIPVPLGATHAAPDGTAPTPAAADRPQHCLALGWPRPQWDSEATASTAANELALLTPTLQRCLIAPIANAGLAPDQRHRLAHLPDPECFDCIAVAGGVVLVHPNGVVLFDDWHRTPLDQSAIETEVDQVGARLALLAQTGTEAKALLERMDRHLKHRRWAGLAAAGNLDRLTGIKVALRRGLDQTAGASADPRLATLRASLERRWGIGDRLEQLEYTIDELEHTLRAYAEQRAARLVTFLTVFGFPLVLFAGFFDFALNGMPREWGALPGWLLGQMAPAANSGPNWPALALFAATAGLGIVLLALGLTLVRWLAGRGR